MVFTDFEGVDMSNCRAWKEIFRKEVFKLI
jgi:hypothetical protein